MTSPEEDPVEEAGPAGPQDAALYEDAAQPDEAALPDDLEPWEGPELGAMLRAALQEPEDLTSSARFRMEETLKGRSLTSTVTDVAGAGIATVWHLLTGVPDPADSNDEDRWNTHD